jgi:ubiquitin-protein ligase
VFPFIEADSAMHLFLLAVLSLVPALHFSATELLDVLRHPPEAFSAHPIDNNLFEWTGTMEILQDTPYTHGLFKSNIYNPKDYLIRPPTVTFATKVYHLNIDSDSGSISLSILDAEWSLVLTISYILLIYVRTWEVLIQ